MVNRTIQLSEPARARYVYIDPTNNQVHLMVPIVGGTDIGTDNTCQSALTMQTFFGKNHTSQRDRTSALHELQRYQTALRADIALSNSLGLPNRAKNERLEQVERYIRTLTALSSQPEIDALSIGYPNYPHSIQNVMRERTNLFSMLLRPRAPDGFTRFVNPVFSINRDEPPLPNGFYETLRRTLPDGIGGGVTKGQRIKQRIKAELTRTGVNLGNPLTTPAQFTALQTALQNAIQTLYNQDINFTTITKQSIDEIYGEDGDFDTYIDGLLGFGAGELETTVNESHFGAVPNRERLSILVQFFLAEINIYCCANQMSRANFGQILDANPALSRDLTTRITDAVTRNQDVEDTIIRFINLNAAPFNLTIPLDDNASRNIKRQFHSDYETVKNSPHFDEFVCFDVTKPGRFYTHQGSICINFAEILSTHPGLDNAYFRSIRERPLQFTEPVPHRNESTAANITVDQAVLISHLTLLMDSIDHIEEVANLMLCSLEGGQRLFQVFAPEEMVQLMDSPHWNQIRQRIVEKINDQPVLLAALDAQYPTIMEFILEPHVLYKLYVSAIVKIGVDRCPRGYETEEQVRELLRIHDIAPPAAPTVRVTDNGCFRISAVPTQLPIIRGSIERERDRVNHSFYLSPDVAASLYKEVNRLFGEHSDAYRHMNQLDNLTSPPRKLMEACRLLNITITNVRFPGGTGLGGYIVDVSAEMERAIHNIHYAQSRIHLTPNMAGALYRRVTALGLGGILEGYDNEYAPNKIQRALQVLGLSHTNLAFNGRDGYWVHMTPHIRARLEVLCQLPTPAITAEEHRDAQQRAAALAPAVASPHVAMAPSIEIQRVAAFRNQPIPATHEPHTVQLNCPESILQAFRHLLTGTTVLGSNFLNPYTGQIERFPEQADQLTARHLQILARNERINVTGQMNVALYQNKLNADQIARLRCLVKATNVAGITYAQASGGYHSARVPLVPPRKTIVVDQAGLQWQGDFRNTGGLFFYPNNNPHLLPPNYAQWQRDMHLALYGVERPVVASGDTMPVQWMGVSGVIDLQGVSQALASEFLQALDAVARRGHHLEPAEQINFRFLKAGMGFFADGLNGRDQVRMEHARLKGILIALQTIQALPAAQQQTALGHIRRMELPFSASLPGGAVPPHDFQQTLDTIARVTQNLGLVWGGTPMHDALTPCEGYVNATTNCGDPHAMTGNEGGYSSVDAAIASNAYVDHLNVAYLPQTQLQLHHSSSYNFTELAPAADLAAVAAPVRPVNEQALITHKNTLLARRGVPEAGAWRQLGASTWEFGRSRHSGNLAFANRQYQIELLANDEIRVLDKQAAYATVVDPAARNRAIDGIVTVCNGLLVPATAAAIGFFAAAPARPANEQALITHKDTLLARWGVPEAGVWRQLGASTWEFGRSRHSRNLAFANRQYQIELLANNEIRVLDKQAGYALVVDPAARNRAIDGINTVCGGLRVPTPAL